MDEEIKIVRKNI